MTVNWPCAVAVPANPIVSFGLSASELTETLPAALPPDNGVNVTLKVTLWPAASVSGKFRPLILNPVPAAVACEIVTLEPPVFVTTSERVTAVAHLDVAEAEATRIGDELA